MNTRKNDWPSRVALGLGIFAAAVALVIIGFVVYVSIYYHDKDVTHQYLTSSEELAVVQEANYLAFGDENAENALILYPGAKVEFSSYAPLARLLAEQDIFCVIVEMPFNLAFFDIDAANSIREQFPDIKNWWIGGHSLGGSMAASHAAQNAEEYKGIILLGSYSADDLSSTDLTACSIIGNQDTIIDYGTVVQNRDLLPSDNEEHLIDGGNHAYLGNYGEQTRDGVATITPKEQWQQTAAIIVSTITGLSHDETWQAIQDAYIYAFPLMFYNSTFNSSMGTLDPTNGETLTTNMLIKSGQGRIYASSEATTQPNTDVYYAQVYLDLSSDAVMFYKPESSLFCSVQVIDPYTNTVKVLGTGTTKSTNDQGAITYLITGPRYSGDVPQGSTMISLSTSNAWLVVRVAIDAQDDGKTADEIYSQLGVMTLTEYLESPGSLAGNANTFNPQLNYNPLQHILDMSAEEYFTAVNELLAQHTPPSADDAALKRFASLGIGAGKEVDDKILEEYEDEYNNMIEHLESILRSESEQFILPSGSWTYYGEPTANFGTEYSYRALLNYLGAAINPSYVAKYFTTTVDSEGEALDGGSSYVIHFDKDEIPASREFGFWSITAYNSKDYLISNAYNKYSVASNSNLVFNEDGSLDIYIQSKAPEDEELRSNWIPVDAKSEFYLMLRVYLPDNSVLDGTWIVPDVAQKTAK